MNHLPNAVILRVVISGRDFWGGMNLREKGARFARNATGGTPVLPRITIRRIRPSVNSGRFIGSEVLVAPAAGAQSTVRRRPGKCGILRLRYARLSATAPLRMTAIWELHPAQKITPA